MNGLEDPHAELDARQRMPREVFEQRMRALAPRFGYVDLEGDLALAEDEFYRMEESGAGPEHVPTFEWKHDTRLFVFEAYIERGSAALPLRRLGIEHCAVDDPVFAGVADVLLARSDAPLLDRLCRNNERHAVAGNLLNFASLSSGLDTGGLHPEMLAEFRRHRDALLREYDTYIGWFGRLGDGDREAYYREGKARLASGDLHRALAKPDDRVVDEPFFWSLLCETRIATASPAEQGLALLKRLEALDGQAIAAFAAHYERALGRLLHHDVWAVAHLIYDRSSLDAFYDFCEAAILHGDERLIEALVADSPDPEALRTRWVPPMGSAPISLEETIDAAAAARTGRPLDWVGEGGREGGSGFGGEPWKEEDLAVRYPSLVAARKRTRN